MIAQQWIIGCEYTTLQTLHLLRPLEIWLNNTILIRLMYATLQSELPVYQ